MNLPRYNQPLPELRRTLDRWRINPSRVRAIWDALDEAERARLIAESAADEPGGTLLPDASVANRAPRDETRAKGLMLEKIIADGVLVARCWAARFGGLITYDGRRNAILLARLIDDGYTAEELIWAGEAYHTFTLASEWHRRQRLAGQNCTKSFEHFYADERIDQWVLKGRSLIGEAQHRLRVAQGRRRTAAEDASAVSVTRRLEAEFGKLSDEEQQRRIERACALLSATRPLIGSRDLRNLLVRSAVLGQLQKDLATRHNDAPSVGQAVHEFLGG